MRGELASSEPGHNLFGYLLFFQYQMDLSNAGVRDHSDSAD